MKFCSKTYFINSVVAERSYLAIDEILENVEGLSNLFKIENFNLKRNKMFNKLSQKRKLESMP